MSICNISETRSSSDITVGLSRFRHSQEIDIFFPTVSIATFVQSFLRAVICYTLRVSSKNGCYSETFSKLLDFNRSPPNCRLNIEIRILNNKHVIQFKPCINSFNFHSIFYMVFISLKVIHHMALVDLVYTVFCVGGTT